MAEGIHSEVLQPSTMCSAPRAFCARLSGPCMAWRYGPPCSIPPTQRSTENTTAAAVTTARTGRQLLPKATGRVIAERGTSLAPDLDPIPLGLVRTLIRFFDFFGRAEVTLLARVTHALRDASVVLRSALGRVVLVTQ